MIRLTCPTCDGAGKVTWHDPPATGPWAGQTKQTCSHCRGKGWVSELDWGGRTNWSR